jgi:hypothetical protein
MVQFQKLTRNLFLTFHGHNIHRKQRQLSKSRDQFSRWRRSRKRLSVCSVLRCPDLWLQCSASFVHGLELLVAHVLPAVLNCAAADGVCFTRVRWEIDFLLTFETAPFFCEYPVYRPYPKFSVSNIALCGRHTWLLRDYLQTVICIWMQTPGVVITSVSAVWCGDRTSMNILVSQTE